MTTHGLFTPSLVAIIVTFNRLEKLKVAVTATLAEPCDALVVIDNCSTDGTHEWLIDESRKFDRLDVITLPRNVGGAGGFEAGFRHTIEKYRPDWLVCFDDDAHPQPGAFQAFKDAHVDGAAAIAAAVYLPDGSICEMNRPSYNPFWHWKSFVQTALGGGRAGFHLADKAYASDVPTAVDATSFVGFFIRRDIVEQIGMPDGRLFIYGDDVLYALRVRQHGGSIRFMPSVTFTHDCGTLSVHERTITPLWKVYYTYRNGLRVYHTAAGKLFWLILPAKLLLWLWRCRLYKSRRAYLHLLVLALHDAAFRQYDRPHTEIVGLATTK